LDLAIDPFGREKIKKLLEYCGQKSNQGARFTCKKTLKNILKVR